MMGGGIHKCPGSSCASNASYLSWLTEKGKGRWVRIFFFQVPLMSLIFVEAVRLRWFLGFLIPTVVIGW